MLKGSMARDDFATLIKEEDAPANGVRGEAKVQAEAGLGDELGGFGVGDFDPSKAAESGGVGADIEASVQEGGVGCVAVNGGGRGSGGGVVEGRAVGADDRAGVVDVNSTKDGGPPHRDVEIGILELHEHECEDGFHATLGEITSLGMGWRKPEGQAV